MRIGVLALQGAFIEHINKLNELGVSTFEIRGLKDIKDNFDGLILPGGESTVQIKLLNELKLFEPLKEKIDKGLPVMGTCAGAILLARDVENSKLKGFQTLPVNIIRNAYGRQLGSFISRENIKGIGDFDMSFIRAPYINNVSDGVEVLSRVDGKIVAVKYKRQLALTFHPELTNNLSIHKYFIEMIL